MLNEIAHDCAAEAVAAAHNAGFDMLMADVAGLAVAIADWLEAHMEMDTAD